jgi:hypothetical protein
VDLQFVVGIGLAVAFGLLPYVVKDMPSWISWPGLGIGIILVLRGFLPGHYQVPLGPSALFVLGCAAMLVAAGWYKDILSAESKSGQTSSMAGRPEIHLSMLGGDVFIPDGEPTLTGIAVQARVWNTGAPSAVIDWSLAIIPHNEQPVFAQFTKIPETLIARGPKNSAILHASDSLDAKTSSTQVDKMPLLGALLFYVALPKSIVQAHDTRWSLSARDIYGKEVRVSQLMGEWLQR